MAFLLLYPCQSLQRRQGFYTSLGDHQASHVATTHGVLSCPLFKVLLCMYWSSSQHEWWNNLVFLCFLFLSFFLDAQSATERNPSEMEAFLGSFPHYLWEKFSCVYTCGVFVSCAQLPLTCKGWLKTQWEMYMRYCGIILGETYRTDLSFHLEAMCTLQNATRANLSINPRYVN